MGRQIEILKPAYRQLRFEWMALRRHWGSWLKNRNRFRGQRGLKVHVACGGNARPGWVNMDLSLRPDVLCWDFRHPLPFDDGAVDLIFSEHFFEHLDHPGYTGDFLAECRRCLAPGGVLRLVVPDAGRYLAAYGGDWGTLAAMRPLTAVDGGWRDRWTGRVFTEQMDLVNEIFRQSGEHRYAWDAGTLRKVLLAAGFDDVREAGFGVSASPEPPIDTPERASESLYMEAVKGG